MNTFIKMMASLAIAVLILIVGCSSGGDDGGGGGNPEGNNGGNNQGTVGNNDPLAMQCDSPGSNPLVGCWQIDACVLASEPPAAPTYLTYFLDFTNEQGMTHHVHTFDNANCTGTPISTYVQPFVTTYEIGESYLSQEGLVSHYLSLTWTVANQSATGYTGFHVTSDSRLCFAGNDLQWTANGGGLSSIATTTGNVATTINLDLCMSKL